MTPTVTKPYADAYQRYVQAGWRGVLPLPPNEKNPPPKGFTGRTGVTPAPGRLDAWASEQPDSNIAIRLPDSVVGIDVDDYKDKHGANTLAEAERRWGPLPATYRSTSRGEDNPSGIRFFRVPQGTEFPGVLSFPDKGLTHVEIIQSHHRFAAVWPSNHPDGRVYEWYDDGFPGSSLDEPPHIDDLPELPAKWIEALKLTEPSDAAHAALDEVEDFLANMPEGPMCSAVEQRLNRAVNDASGPDAGSRHDAALTHVQALLRLADQGHLGVADALEVLEAVFVEAVGKDRGSQMAATSEFRRIVHGRGGIGRILASPTPEAMKGCICGMADAFGQTKPGPSLTVVEPQDGEPEMEDKEDDELRPSWSPVDLSNVLNGTVQLEIPGLLHREDGTGLFYPGRIHWLYGETESGKSWVAQATAAQVLIAGGQVLYVDHESDVASVVGRLLLLGADKSAMLERFHYVQPETSAAREYAAFASLLDNEYAFATIDGVTDALGLETAKTVDTDEVAGWMRRVPRLIARKTGAAVVCIDHVTKSNDGRGRFPIGSQAKLAGIDGVAYLAEPTMPLGVGKRGEIELRIAKDRPGVLRPQSGEWRKSDRTQLAGTFVLDSTTSPTTVTVLRPDMAPAAPFKPTMLMERVSMLLEGESGLSARKIREQVQGNNNAIVLALDHLVTEGFVRRDTVTNGFVHSSVRPYRQNEQGGTSGSPYREGGPPVPPTQPDPGVDQVPPQVPPGTAGQGRYHPSTAVDSRGGLGRGTTPGTTPSQQDHCRACRVPYTAPNGMPFCPSCGAMPDEEGAA